MSILREKEIINYVKRRRRFHGISELDSPRAKEGLAALEALDSKHNSPGQLTPIFPVYGQDYDHETIHGLFSKELRDLFMEGWNFLIQGPFSGDIPKLMISCVARRWQADGIRAVPFLSLYDSVECACDPDQVERAVKVATPYFIAPPLHLLTDEIPIWKVVPLDIEWSVGPTWDTKDHKKIKL